MDENNTLPISTKWLKESVNKTDEKVIDFVFMIRCKTGAKGTGFLYKNKYILTNYHVIKDCNQDEIIAISNKNEQLEFKDVIIDKDRDFALLTLKKPLDGGLEIDDVTEIKPGIKISTWGFPLGYNGPSPLFSVGYISGFRNHKEKEKSPLVKHIVVNGAFNPGNSGGPLFIFGSKKIVGVVVNKHTPFTHFQMSALEALSKNKSGLQYMATNEEGLKINFAESQLVADLLSHFRELTQVMIGEAIDRSELIKFIKNNVE